MSKSSFFNLVKFSTGASKSISLSNTVYEDKENLDKAKSPVVIIHGFLGSKQNWSSTSKKLLKGLSGRRKLIAIDVRNHGESPHYPEHNYGVITEDIHNLLKEFQIERVSFIGHSMGGKTAMSYEKSSYSEVHKGDVRLNRAPIAVKLDTKPDSVNQLIIGDVAPVKYPQVRLLDHLLDAMLEVKMPSNVDRMTATAIVNKQLKLKIQSKATRGFLMMNLIPDKHGGYRWKCNLPVLKENVNNILTWPEVKGVFNKPVLFVAGSESNLIRPEDEPVIKSYFPNAELIQIEGAAHNVHTDKPQEFLDACLKYLNNN